MFIIYFAFIPYLSKGGNVKGAGASQYYTFYILIQNDYIGAFTIWLSLKL